VRALIVRLTAVTAAAAGLFAGALTASTRAPWMLVALRAAVAIVVVLAIGAGAGLILMRTALRRHYEQDQAVLASRRARGNR
jgi:hypothetical protein